MAMDYNVEIKKSLDLYGFIGKVNNYLLDENLINDVLGEKISNFLDKNEDIKLSLDEAMMLKGELENIEKGSPSSNFVNTMGQEHTDKFSDLCDEFSQMVDEKDAERAAKEIYYIGDYEEEEGEKKAGRIYQYLMNFPADKRKKIMEKLPREQVVKLSTKLKTNWRELLFKELGIFGDDFVGKWFEKIFLSPILTTAAFLIKWPIVKGFHSVKNRIEERKLAKGYFIKECFNALVSYGMNLGLIPGDDKEEIDKIKKDVEKAGNDHNAIMGIIQDKLKEYFEPLQNKDKREEMITSLVAKHEWNIHAQKPKEFYTELSQLQFVTNFFYPDVLNQEEIDEYVSGVDPVLEEFDSNFTETMNLIEFIEKYNVVEGKQAEADKASIQAFKDEVRKKKKEGDYKAMEEFAGGIDKNMAYQYLLEHARDKGFTVEKNEFNSDDFRKFVGEIVAQTAHVSRDISGRRRYVSDSSKSKIREALKDLLKIHKLYFSRGAVQDEKTKIVAEYFEKDAQENVVIKEGEVLNAFDNYQKITSGKEMSDEEKDIINKVR
jgi:hypothetical protein